ncbi:probable pectinesterase/pectinesterase inhibitor 35 [Pyrus x bretschneideri]|uniref:probable pectinesterase/pectinesterase inhibitor 35 n=1 Tax=Pyrus x bretschneideri TaxID=225117 RepID=UPI00202EBEDE|nr:probable pectinesterase/pectinesterase inhibitor 35 [Pyrus x bretschneideri]
MFTILSSSNIGEDRSKTHTFFLSMFLIIQILLLSAEANQASSPSLFSKFSRAGPSKEANNIVSFCKHTPHQAACESIFISKTSNITTITKPPPQTLEGLFVHSVDFSIIKASLVRALAYNLTISHRQTSHQTHSLGVINDCLELVEDSIDLLDNVILKYDSTKSAYSHADDDIQSWLSAALTNQETCLDSLASDKSMVDKGSMETSAQNINQFISNSLSLFMLTSRSPKQAQKKNPSNNVGGRRLLSDDFPSWVSGAERKLLEASVGDLEAHAVVALDGSGTHKSIGEALGLVASLAESGDGGRSVIHVKAGTYHEYIKIPTKQKNVMLIGDGLGATIIVGDRNSEDGWTTFQSATVAAMGDGFIARDITFENNAGPSKHQAVALRVGADKSVIFRCSIVGYQDTLYTLSKRQFYRDTQIYGTVDFIFGNSAAVFQNCNIYARKPASTGLKNFVTAQGRTSPDQNTGISIHNCKISAASDLAPVKSKYETYLGRPWKQHSRTVIMQSYLDDSISRAGWSPWSGGFALNTLYYGEYSNYGPGASTLGRVRWPGYHASLTPVAAQAFTVGGFISGNLWLPSTGVSFDSGLIK